MSKKIKFVGFKSDVSNESLKLSLYKYNEDVKFLNLKEGQEITISNNDFDSLPQNLFTDGTLILVEDGDLASVKQDINGRGINVKSFGAKGNGTDDDTSAIQAAVLAAVGSRLIIPNGSYRFKNISIPSDSYIQIESNAKIIAPVGTTNTDSFFLITGTVGTNKSRVKIEGGVFDGANLMSCGVNIDYGSDILIQDSKFVNMITGVNTAPQGVGLSIKNSKDVRVNGVWVDTATVGVLSYRCDRGIIENCTLLNTSRDGILCYDGTKNIKISNNHVDIYCTSGETGRAGIHIYGSSDTIVTGNTVLNGQFDAEGIRFRDANRFTCVGNYVKTPGASAIAVVRIGDFVGLDGGDGTISGNFILNAGLHGITVSYALNKPVSITGNTIKNTITTNPSDPATAILVGANYCSIIGNTIDTAQGDGIDVSGTFNTITGNTIRNVGTGTIGARVGIFLTGTDNVCTGNTINDDQGTHTMINGIRLFSTATAIIKNNNINGATSSAYRLDGKMIGENSGSIILANGATSVLVTHGLRDTPTNIIISPMTDGLGSPWVTNITATTFTINVAAAPSKGSNIGWRVSTQ
ncbi:MAG: pectate lyase superfamily protein [Bacillales bacterium]|jgi:hypothetical protein|nr:pectate lyase superfamily protein [Bacillales bacterium]